MTKRTKLWPSTIAFRITNETRAKVEKLAEKSKCTISEFIRDRIELLILNSEKQ